MVALYRSGRQADASATYQWAREVLADELGIDPSEELQRLHERIDALRCAKLPLYRGQAGPLIGPSAYFMKSPPVQFSDEAAREMVEQFILGNGASKDADWTAFLRHRPGGGAAPHASGSPRRGLRAGVEVEIGPALLLGPRAGKARSG